ncbi:hypothetical protein ACFQ3N_17400 [Virgibacillus byunsanensis]|uniref:DUF3953 domain-containing protein n=1 Tax=Virgibacillus byunsanensis TaxID=570945 RepID=A0ABW3LRX9_9BACI
MNKKTIKEFVFNSKKYKGIKIVLLILFLLVINSLSKQASSESFLSMLIIPVLFLFSIVTLLKIVWYNKTENVKNDKKDIILFIGIVILLVYSILFF